MGEAVSALLPILLVIWLGHWLRAREWLDAGFWSGATWLNYYFLFPALLMGRLAKANMATLPLAGMALAVVGATTGVALATLLVRTRLAHAPFRLGAPAFTSLFQCIQRPNTYVALAVTTNLWGGAGLDLGAVCVAMAVPLVNVYCVLALWYWGDRPGQSRSGPLRAIREVISNPLILSSLAGLALALIGTGLPRVLDGFLDILAGASLGLGLLSVGAGLSLRALIQTGPSVGLAIAVKMAVLPALSWIVAAAAGLTGLPLAAVVVFGAMPASQASFVLAKRMGGDAELVASILSAQLVAGILLLPLWFSVLGP